MCPLLRPRTSGCSERRSKRFVCPHQPPGGQRRGLSSSKRCKRKKRRMWFEELTAAAAEGAGAAGLAAAQATADACLGTVYSLHYHCGKVYYEDWHSLAAMIEVRSDLGRRCGGVLIDMVLTCWKCACVGHQDNGHLTSLTRREKRCDCRPEYWSWNSIEWCALSPSIFSCSHGCMYTDPLNTKESEKTFFNLSAAVSAAN